MQLNLARPDLVSRFSLRSDYNIKIFKSEQSPHAGSQGSHHTITIRPKFKALALTV